MNRSRHPRSSVRAHARAIRRIMRIYERYARVLKDIQRYLPRVADARLNRPHSVA